MARKLRLEAIVTGPVNDVFASLAVTLAFRRWGRGPETELDRAPGTGSRYRFHFGSVLREGRIVELIRPVGITLKEILHDPPCRVALCMRWRVEPVGAGCLVRLLAEYRLNHAATLRGRHWQSRLRHHFGNQIIFLQRELGARLEAAGAAGEAVENVI